jgi:phage baseplate assembly protein W
MQKIKVLKFPYDGTYVENEKAVHQIIKMLLETPLRDIFYSRKRGSQITRALFEANDNVLRGLASNYINDCLTSIKYITVKEILVEVLTEKVKIKIIWSSNNQQIQSTELDFPRN